MDIAAVSTALANTNVQNQVGVAMLSKSLDLNETMGDSLINMIDRSMELSVTPHIGSNIDISV